MIAFFSLFHHLTDDLGALTDLAGDLKGIWKREKKIICSTVRSFETWHDRAVIGPGNLRPTCCITVVYTEPLKTEEQ